MAIFEIKDAKTCGVELAEVPLMVSNNLNRLISKIQQDKGLMVDITGNIEKGLYGFGVDLDKAFHVVDDVSVLALPYGMDDAVFGT